MHDGRSKEEQSWETVGNGFPGSLRFLILVALRKTSSALSQGPGRGFAKFLGQFVLLCAWVPEAHMVASVQGRHVIYDILGYSRHAPEAFTRIYKANLTARVILLAF
jgi:hypothetical protein